MSVGKALRDAGSVIQTLGYLGMVGIILLVLYGNLSGNLGFAALSTGANNTNLVINNITGGFLTFFGFSNTFFTIAALLVLFTLFGVILSKVSSFTGQSRGFSE